MAMSLRCVVGQLSVVGGVRRSQSENVLVVEPGSYPTSPRSSFGLYALIELSGLFAPPEDLCQGLLNILRAEFYQSSGSVSASLGQAILRVNQALYDFNVNAVRDERQGGGITCAALRDNELYIAQGGPALAYLAGSGQIFRFPRYSPWFDEDVPEDQLPRPLGASLQIEPDLSHRQFAVGDFFILSDSILGQLTSVEQVQDAMLPGDVGLTAHRLGDLVGDDDEISLIVIEAQSEASVVDDELLPEEELDIGEEDFDLLDEPLEEVVVPQAKLDVTPVTPHTAQPKARRKGTVGRRAPTGLVGAAGGFVNNAWNQFDWSGIVGSGRNGLNALWTSVLLFLGVVWDNIRVLAVRVLPGGHEIEIKPRKKRKPAPVGKEKTAEREHRKPVRPVDKRSRVLKYVAIAIPLFVLVIVGAVYLERERAAYDAHEKLVQAARAKYDQALSEMADVETARSLLADAVDFLDEAKTSLPVVAEPPNLRKDILKTMDQINKVERVYWIPRLGEFNSPETDLGRIVVDGINIYVLDRGTNQVFKQTLNETEDGFVESNDSPVLISKGSQIGDVVVGELLDMNWMPAGGGHPANNLVVVDKKGALFDEVRTGIENLPLDQTDEWLYPQFIAGFFGNLYVLDGQRNQILKYESVSDGGYSFPPVQYFNEDADVDLTGAVDMAIDGYIYVLYADGKISKFMSGDTEPFEITGLDVPLNNPSAVFTNADQDTQYLYVADRGNQRIVQLTKDGRFQRQFKVDSDSRAFDDLRSLWVDELEQKIYIVSGNGVYMTNLVAE